MNSFSYGPSWGTHEGGPLLAQPRVVCEARDLDRECLDHPRGRRRGGPPLHRHARAPRRFALLYSSSSDAVDHRPEPGLRLRPHAHLARSHACQVPGWISSPSDRSGTANSTATPSAISADPTSLASPPLSSGRGSSAAARSGSPPAPPRAMNSIVRWRRSDDLLARQAWGGGLICNADRLRPDPAPPHRGKSRSGWPQGGRLRAGRQANPSRLARGATVLAKFQDGSPAVVQRGKVYCGRLSCPRSTTSSGRSMPVLVLEEKKSTDAKSVSAEDAALLERSANPWNFPRPSATFPRPGARGRRRLAHRVRHSARRRRAHDPRNRPAPAPCELHQTQPPRQHVATRHRTPAHRPRRIRRARSAELSANVPRNAVEFSLPLESNDFVKLYFH